MMIREAAMAGRFYAGDPEQCRADLLACLAKANAAPMGAGLGGRPDRVIGAVVPHAGWACSGAVAARVFEAVRTVRTPDVVIIFGAIHVQHGPRATIFPTGAWETPLGLAYIDERLSSRLHGQTGLLEVDPHAHENEHSIEVEVPFIQHLMPQAKIIPIMVPAGEHAAMLGSAVGRACRAFDANVLFVASTDLTHYGPRFAFAPRGVGPEGLAWARDVNDRRMIEAIRAMHEESIVPEARANLNACGAGAVAATIAACKVLGATRAELLEHTTSHDVLRSMEPDAQDSVGYAGMLIG